MKICAAQIRPYTGDILLNIDHHQSFISKAIEEEADLIFFPELSLSGYEPSLAKKLALESDDNLLNVFQIIADKNHIIIGIGIPLKQHDRIYISTIIFQPNKARTIYSKQYLHEDEKSIFTPGKEQQYISFEDHKIAFAICYESLIPAHAEKAHKSGANLYLASVAKASTSVLKAYDYFPKMANRFKMAVLMANAIGPCDNFESAGHSAIWSFNGNLEAQLDDQKEGLLFYDTVTGKSYRIEC